MWNRRKKRRNVSKEVSELLSPASIEKSKNIPQQLRNLLLEKLKQEQNNDKELNSVIEGISDGIENLIDNYLELVAYKAQVQRTRRTFQRTMSFFLLALSGVIIFFVSSLLINDLSGIIVFTLVVGALVGIFPISYIAYSFYKSEVQKERLANDLRLLGLVSEQNIDEINELYSTVYNPFQFGVYIVLFVTLSSLIFASYYIVTTEPNRFNFIEANTVKIIFYAFLGSYFFGIQLLVRRYNVTFHSPPISKMTCELVKE
ncbi:hypothetical protein [Iningainema tapete]|uniref:Uncharacterized protein n=1 Tax=Iningainema tapete BLCC-T55 TaxID=2748662 RepID=A0A8J6XN06_9CYAN|nr:hypothetical protein [Iningainema tapete]MBD2778013.1 hypothetical protein [Iningainema tapete BLCC-T55]